MTKRKVAVVFGVAMLVGLLLNCSIADDLPRAIVEVPASLARHLSIDEGRVVVNGKHAWETLRNFHVQLVENEDINLNAPSDMPDQCDLLLQLTPGEIDIGIDAGGTLSLVPRAPFQIQVPLHLRLRTRGVKSYAGGDVGKLFFHYLRVKEYPDGAAQQRAVVGALGDFDRALNQTIGVYLLHVEPVRHASQTKFRVRLENVYSFPIKGTLRFPEASTYRVDQAEHPFHLTAGGTTEMEFELNPIDPGKNRAMPEWWTRKVYGERERYRRFEFPQLLLNAPTEP